jgi:4-hydroxybenzoate polyprenyltransferase
MVDQFCKMLSMIRFSHTIFALPFALLAAVMAWTAPANGADVGFQWLHLVGIVLCMIGARSAAMAFNRLADRDIDAQNPRTQSRHLPTGQLSVRQVWLFTIGSATVFAVGTLFFLPNWLPSLAALPVLAVLLGYSYAKRFTSLAHFWLGAALMLAPICAWIAIRGSVVMQTPADIAPAATLGLAVLFWVTGFDTIYACQDHEFDRQANLKSLPVWLGIPGALKLAAGCHFMMIGLLLVLPALHNWVGPNLGLGWMYWLAVAAVAALLIYEHWLVRPDNLTRVNIAFFNVNAVLSIGLFLATAIDLLAV